MQIVGEQQPVCVPRGGMARRESCCASYTLRKLDQKVLSCKFRCPCCNIMWPAASGKWQLLAAACLVPNLLSRVRHDVAATTAPAAVPHLFAWHFLAKTDNLLVPHVRCAKFHGNNNIYYNHNASNWHQMCKGKSCRAAAFMRSSLVP